jgi:GNAT superfamily N-acetyltransferase
LVLEVALPSKARHRARGVELLLAARTHRGLSLGGELVDTAERIARERTVSILRVDCWAGAPTLVRWYENQGFTRNGTFDVRGWKGQIFTRSVPHLSSGS